MPTMINFFLWQSVGRKGKKTATETVSAAMAEKAGDGTELARADQRTRVENARPQAYERAERREKIWRLHIPTCGAE